MAYYLFYSNSVLFFKNLFLFLTVRFSSLHIVLFMYAIVNMIVMFSITFRTVLLDGGVVRRTGFVHPCVCLL